MVDGIVDLMARRIAPVYQPFDAPLPGGQSELLSSLARSGRWGALEEQGEKMDKLPKPNDDAYRLYLVALAKEAQAYDLTREANDRDLGKRTDISETQAKPISRERKKIWTRREQSTSRSLPKTRRKRTFVQGTPGPKKRWRFTPKSNAIRTKMPRL